MEKKKSAKKAMTGKKPDSAQRALAGVEKVIGGKLSDGVKKPIAN
jgi:hypothetical protein